MTQGKYVNVNGLNMYYEIHGTGRPLVCFMELCRRSAPLSENFYHPLPKTGRS